MATRDRVLRHPSAAPPVRGGGCHGPGLWSKRGRLQPRAGCQWLGRHRTRGRSRPAGSGRRAAGLQVAVIVPGLFLSAQLTCRRDLSVLRSGNKAAARERIAPLTSTQLGSGQGASGGRGTGPGSVYARACAPPCLPAAPAGCPPRAHDEHALAGDWPCAGWGEASSAFEATFGML